MEAESLGGFLSETPDRKVRQGQLQITVKQVRVNRWKDWLEQARINLAHAERSLEMGDFAWACFAAQQAAEAGIKGLHYRLGQVAWGHSILDLLTGLPGHAAPSEGLLDRARRLDRHYIPTRYPDVHPAGPAARHYTADDAREAIDIAREVLRHCERASLEA